MCCFLAGARKIVGISMRTGWISSFWSVKRGTNLNPFVFQMEHLTVRECVTDLNTLDAYKHIKKDANPSRRVLKNEALKCLPELWAERQPMHNPISTSSRRTKQQRTVLTHFGKMWCEMNRCVQNYFLTMGRQHVPLHQCRVIDVPWTYSMNLTRSHSMKLQHIHYLYR